MDHLTFHESNVLLLSEILIIFHFLSLLVVGNITLVCIQETVYKEICIGNTQKEPDLVLDRVANKALNCFSLLVD